MRSGNYYVVYIATADLLRLAEEDEAVRSAIALYLAEMAKNGTPKQREIAEKILQRHHFLTWHSFKAKPAHKTTTRDLYHVTTEEKWWTGRDSNSRGLPSRDHPRAKRASFR